MPIVHRVALALGLAGVLIAGDAFAPALAIAQTCDPFSPQNCLIPGWDDPLRTVDCRIWDDESPLVIPYPCIPPFGAGGP